MTAATPAEFGRLDAATLPPALQTGGAAQFRPDPLPVSAPAMTAPIPLAPGSLDGSVAPASFAAPAPSSTAVGQKAAQLRAEHDQLRGTVISQQARVEGLQRQAEADAADYYTVVGGINARLQAGTTPGNPRLVEQWQTAQARLSALSADVDAMNAMAGDLGISASVAGYLDETITSTLGISGAVEEDHAALRALQDEVAQSVVVVERLLNEVAAAVNRHAATIAQEQRNLQALSLAISRGERIGPSLAAAAPDLSPAAAANLPGVPAASQGRPLVTIRFDGRQTDYEQAVYEAVNSALERYPTAAFEVVAVSPQTDNPATAALAAGDSRRNAEAVVRTLTRLGVPIARLTVSATTDTGADGPEVRIFLR